LSFEFRIYENIKMLKIVSKKEVWLPIAILVIVGSFIYAFNLNNKLFWDDDDWIINNNFVHTVSWNNIKFWFSNDVLAGIGLKSNYYRPFLFFTFALNYVISGIKPFSYHLFSNLIHIANGVLVFLLLKRFDFGISRGRTLATVFLTALIFTINPLQTEAVTYISGRGDVLVTFFILLALILFHRLETIPMLSIGGIQNLTLHRVLSLVFLTIALLNRETAIIFPFLALAFYVSFISKDRFIKSIKRGLIATWPYFAVVIIYGILRLTILNFQDTLNFYSEQNLYSENLYVRMFTFLPILLEYLKLLVVPVGLHMERSATIYTSLFQWPVWAVGLGIIGLLFWLKYLYKNQIVVFRLWLFGILWFFIALGPVSGVTPINALMYEHWLYLPMVGFWLIVSFYLVKLLDYQGSTFLKIQGYRSRTSLTLGELCRTLVIVALVVYLFFFGYQSIQRNILWGNQVEFYKNILKYEPGSVRINNNLGNQYFNQGDKEKAEFYYRKAVESEDSFAQPHFNIGSILQSRGDVKGAIAEFEKAIEIDSNFFYPYQNLAVIYAQQGDFVQAVINIEKLKLLLSNNPRVYYNSALVYIALGNKEKAVSDLNEGLKYSSVDPEAGRLIGELINKLQK